MGGGRGRVAAKLEYLPQPDTDHKGDHRPKPQAPIGHQMERGKEQGSRKKTDDRLQECANQGLFGEPGKKRYRYDIDDRPPLHHVALPLLEMRKGRQAPQEPHNYGAHRAGAKTGENGSRCGTTSRQPDEQAVRTERKADQRDEPNDALLVDQDDRRYCSGRSFFVWAHGVMTARSVSGLFSRWIVDAINSLLDIEALLIVLDGLGPRHRHHSVSLIQAYDTHTLGGETEA